jgi:hypothetical protein
VRVRFGTGISDVGRATRQAFERLGHGTSTGGGDTDVSYTNDPTVAAAMMHDGPTILHLDKAIPTDGLPEIEALSNCGGLLLLYEDSMVEQLGWGSLVRYGVDPSWWVGWDGKFQSVLYYMDTPHANDPVSTHTRNGLNSGRNAQQSTVMGEAAVDMGAKAACNDVSPGSRLSAMRSHRLYYDCGDPRTHYTPRVVEAAMVGMPLSLPNHQHHKSSPQCRYNVSDYLGSGDVGLPRFRTVPQDRTEFSSSGMHSSSGLARITSPTPRDMDWLAERGASARRAAVRYFSHGVVDQQLNDALSGWGTA